MLLARAAQREHEFAVSRALGANGAAIVRATLFEGALLGLVGGVAGALAAIWGTRALVALAPLDLPRREAIAVDWRIAAVGDRRSACCSASSPRSRRRRGRRAHRCRRCSRAAPCAAAAVTAACGAAMVVAQVALSLVLLSTGGLVVRSFERLLRADPGFSPEGVLTLRVPMPTQFIPEAAEALALQDGVERALAAIPGVTGVSATSALPLTAAASQKTIRIPGAPGNTGDAEQRRAAGRLHRHARELRRGDGHARRSPAAPSIRSRRDGRPRGADRSQRSPRQFFPAGSPLGAKIPVRRQSDR